MTQPERYRTTAITEDRVKLLINEAMSICTEKQEAKMEDVYGRLNKLEANVAFIKGKFEGWGGNLTGRQKTVVGGLSFTALVELILIITKYGGG